VALEKAEVLLSMNHGIAHLDNIWGCGGGNRPVILLTNKVIYNIYSFVPEVQLVCLLVFLVHCILEKCCLRNVCLNSIGSINRPTLVLDKEVSAYIQLAKSTVPHWQYVYTLLVNIRAIL